MRCLLDTDVASAILKARNPHVAVRAHAYLTQHGNFAISLMTRHEILRGHRAK